ncbi:MAG: hypothetical protein D6791_14115 [Chloroflexi bacterium]|nr:MAG: hypothetical protein D6791_14115 [Chloroflexota bacterium]
MKYLPRKKYLSSLVVVVLLLAQVLTLSPILALAAPPAPVPSTDKYNPSLTADEIRSQFGLDNDVDVVTDSEMSRLIALCHTIGAYLVRLDDGTLELRLDNPRTVGVSETFLNNYRTGIDELNALVKRGWISFDDELNIVPGSNLPTSQAEIDAGLAEVENEIAGKNPELSALPEGETPQHHYRRGFLFSFHSYRYRVPYYYASLGPTFASRFGYGLYGARFSLLFGLNRSFLHGAFRYGGYGYVPYYYPYRYGYNVFYYYPYRYYGGYYGRWYYRYLWY